MTLPTVTGLAAPADRPRFAIIDAIRGIALLAMATFHTVWDLSDVGFIAATVPVHPVFRAYGHTIAGTFFALAGISLTLSWRHGIDRRAYERRLLILVAAALAISVATAWTEPQAPIFFGMLHCLAATSLAALLFRRAPSWLVGLAALVALALPLVVASPWLDNPVVAWLGLGTLPPVTLDWRPFFPWVGVVLLGLLAGRWMFDPGLPAAIASWPPNTPASRPLLWGGRHSLLIYLVHQPILLGLVWLAAQVALPVSPADTQAAENAYMTSCTAPCRAKGSGADYCSRACGCTLDALKRADLWSKALDGTLTAGDRVRFGALGAVCERQSLTASPSPP